MKLVDRSRIALLTSRATGANSKTRAQTRRGNASACNAAMRMTEMKSAWRQPGFPPAPKTATVEGYRRSTSRLSPGTLVDNQTAPSAGRSLLALSLLWLSGASLRFTVLAVPPVVPLLHADLHLSETGIGWLASLPPMLFAIAAVPGAMLIARFGIVPALIMGLLLNALGGALRGAVRPRPSSSPRQSRWRPASPSCSRRCRHWCGAGSRRASALPPRSIPTGFWSARRSRSRSPSR